MKCTYQALIRASAETVFAFLDEPDKLKQWMDGLEDTQHHGPLDPHNPVGTRFTQRIREAGRVTEYHGEVTAYEKPRRLGVRLMNDHFAVDVDYRLTPAPAGTQLNYSAHITSAKLWVRAMTILFSWFTNRILRRQMAALKRLAEAGAGPADVSASARATFGEAHEQS